jgi:DNA-binding transcriptional LysR family regulator
MLAQFLVAPRLPVLHARHPALRVELNIGMESVNLTRRDADIALRMAAPDNDDTIAKRIGKMDFGLYRSDSDGGATNTLAGMAPGMACPWRLRCVWRSRASRR